MEIINEGNLEGSSKRVICGICGSDIVLMLLKRSTRYTDEQHNPLYIYDCPICGNHMYFSYKVVKKFLDKGD